MTVVEFLHPTLLMIQSVLCMSLALQCAYTEWDPFESPTFPMGRVILHWLTLLFLCVWITGATNAWYGNA